MKEPSAIKKIHDIFTKRERQYALLLLLLSLLTGIAQSVSVISVLPFLNVVLDPGIIMTNQVFRSVYDFLGFTHAMQFLIFLGGLVFLALLVSNALSALNIWAKMRFINRRNHSMSVKLLSKYLHRPYEAFLTKNSNELVKNVLAEVQILTTGYLLAFIEIITSASILLFIILTILIIDVTASMVAVLVFGTLYGSIMLFLRSKLKKRGELVRLANEKRYRFTIEALSSFKTTKVMHAEKHFIQSFSKSSSDFAKHNTFALVAGAMPRFLIETIAVGGLILFVVIQLALGRELETLAPIVGVLGLAGYRMLPALQIIFSQVSNLQYTKPVLDRIYEDLMDATQQHSHDDYVEEAEALSFEKEIVLSGISFKYASADISVLHELSLTIHKNQTIGFVGTTGSGKTTLVDILMGLLKPQSGSILVDDTPLHENNIRAWQKNLGYVPQDIYLSDDTLANNIAFGIEPEKVNLERVKKAASIAAIDKFIDTELPLGYLTMVGERGVRLSGGQRQRIGIARALYHNPKVLILDEATSALDGNTETAVLDAIKSAASNRTVIMVAHRLNTLQDCDTIYLLKKGNIVASGIYESLLKENKTFQRMAKQSK